MNNPLNLYRFGSHVYGTNHEGSDEDFIQVTLEKEITDNINIHSFTVTEFQSMLNNHDIEILECYFLPEEFKLKETYKEFTLSLDLGKLRVSISTITSNSWVKGKKKLTVMGDYDKYTAIKSIFHSIRILGLGIQIATHQRIIDYTEYKWLFQDLMKLASQYDYIELWEKIDAKYRSLFKELSSQFKQLCPKNNIPQQQLKEKLIQLFKDNHCYSKEVIDSGLINQLVQLFNE
jgi:hypothetical protein